MNSERNVFSAIVVLFYRPLHVWNSGLAGSWYIQLERGTYCHFLGQWVTPTPSQRTCQRNHHYHQRPRRSGDPDYQGIVDATHNGRSRSKVNKTNAHLYTNTHIRTYIHTYIHKNWFFSIFFTCFSKFVSYVASGLFESIFLQETACFTFFCPRCVWLPSCMYTVSFRIYLYNILDTFKVYGRAWCWSREGKNWKHNQWMIKQWILEDKWFEKKNR